ncbi:MAG TPA: hypothetical protein VF169_08280 [Albitalea sp.]|uniref:hypothetical protein n=1 Tax=Piscinibacter sp. TaxID=1903157 RepID=UPI002ED22645
MHSLLPSRLASAALLATLLACGGGGGDAPPATTPVIVPVDGPAWPGFGGNAQHSAIGAVQAQPLTAVAWHAPLDLVPPYQANGSLLIHYGSPVISRHNTVLMPVKTGAGSFRVDARIGQTGSLRWSLASDYRLPTPAPTWTPSFNIALTPGGRLYMPAAGGRLRVREDVDNDAIATTGTVAFYSGACDTCDTTVHINTPLTTDSQGNVFFGFSVNGANSLGLTGGGIARIAADGTGSYVLASAASGDAAIVKPQVNSAPALSADEQTLYVVVNNRVTAPTRASGRLLALNSSTLATVGNRPLLDPASGAPAWVSDNATSSPTVGPDGDVYIGVLEATGTLHNFRGWLLHFNAALTTVKTPAAFGWDITASVVPRAMVPQYTGPSSYLLAIKYNNYGGAGGDGRNRMAVVDPGQSQADAYGTSVMVMREILTILGPTADPAFPGGVKEWCVNTVAVDPLGSSLLVNSEDGKLYRWHLPSNLFTEQVVLTGGLAEAYTPTAIGADGRVYAVNNATLFSVGR